jgi:hypothetical protein
MPVHDWTRVSAGTFHHFHNSWITHLCDALNEGLLPPGYFAIGEQHAGQIIPDVMTLRTSSAPRHRGNDGAIALAETPPQTRLKVTADEGVMYQLLQQTLTIRHSSDNELVAIMEIVSPSNKDRVSHVEDLVAKVRSAFEKRIHVLLIDLLPPTRHDPHGMHGAVWLHYAVEPYDVPASQPLTLAAYLAEPIPIAYVEPVGVGETLNDMPLFLDPDWYVNTPLESTYARAVRSVPPDLRQLLED